MSISTQPYEKSKAEFSAIRAYKSDHERIKAIVESNNKLTIASVITMLLDIYAASEKEL
jgi:hypothetical protein